MLWFLWAPLILIGVIALILLAVFIAGIYGTEYGKDEYEISVPSYDGDDRFFVTDEYELVVADGGLMTIAEKFNGYIEKILGRPLAVADKKGDRPYIELCVSPSEENAYTLAGDNRNISITADSRAHLLSGCCAFLEEFGGVAYYTSKLIEYSSDKIFFPVREGGYSQSYNDYFEMRDTDWMSPKDDEYSYFRGLNCGNSRFTVRGKSAEESEDTAARRIRAELKSYEALGGAVRYLSGFCHTFTSTFLNSSEYFDKGLNLECYALDSKGKRRRDELCLSNPKTLEIVTREVFDILENKNSARTGKYYEPDAPLQIISLTQSDDLTACKCRECVACAKAHGGYSAPNLLFVNKVAQAVKDAGYKNVAIDTFAYRYTRSAPKDIVPLDNVIIRLCSIECCASHYLDDEKCLSNKAFMKDLADWSKICDRIYIWDYCSDFSYFLTLFPDFRVLAHNIRVFYEHNVRGLYEEGNYTLDLGGADPEFAELRAYLITRVMQNPYCDCEAVMREFCDAYYGEAGEDIYRFLEKADRWAGRKHLNIYKNPKYVLKCSKAEFKELNDLMEHAKSVATGQAAEHVRNSEICWRYFKMYNRLFEFSKSSEFETAREHLLTDMGRLGTTRLHEVEANYKQAWLAQTGMVDFRPAFDIVVGKFVYGP